MDLLRRHDIYNRVQDHDPPVDSDDVIMLSPFGADTPGLQSNSFPADYDSTYHLRSTEGDSDRDGDTIAKSSATRTSGWRLGAMTAASLAIVSLICNVAAIGWLSGHRDSATSLVEVFRGDCAKAHHMDVWVHFIINGLSTALLGGSNYCMQCLCSPSREEVDHAHSNARVLDIGVPSVRNVFAIGRLRKVLWWMLALSSIPLHLMYNSAFYTSVGALSYDYYFVRSEYLAGDVRYNSSRNIDRLVEQTPEAFYTNYETNQTQFYNLSTAECIREYAQSIPTRWGNLILITSNFSDQTVLRADHYDYGGAISGTGAFFRPFQWLCTSDPQLGDKIGQGQPGFKLLDACEPYVDKLVQIADQWTPYSLNIEYCLAQAPDQKCTFSGNIPIIAVVIVCNAIKAMIMLFVAFRLPGQPLITIGDAIQSFLEKPDPTTRGACWLTRRDVLDYSTYAHHFPHAPWPATMVTSKAEAKAFPLRRRRWFAAAGGSRWFSTIGFVVAALVASSVLFAWGLTSLKSASYYGLTADIRALGFGTLQPRAIITSWDIASISDPSQQILANVLIANLPQLVLSFLYLNINGLLTSMYLGAEWARFATHRKFLRVSTPRGQQRSTHFLQLPYQISLPLMVTSGLLHWLVSQSIFLAVVSAYDATGELVNATAVASCGYSLLPTLVCIIFTFSVLCGFIALGCRRYDARIPLVGSCSAAISAACHAPRWDVDAALKRLTYGHIVEPSPLQRESENDDIAHACFTSGEVEFVKEGVRYAGVVERKAARYVRSDI